MMSREPIENEYFNWLCTKVMQRQGNLYIDLMRILHHTEFVWIVHGDQNRAEDGAELRADFIRETDWEIVFGWYHEPASVLEVLIAFSFKAQFQTDISSGDWFWRFMTNLGLEEYRQVSGLDQRRIEDILHTFVWRNYDACGHGGLFPLTRTNHNQREVEIWYQFCEYLEDQCLI